MSDIIGVVEEVSPAMKEAQGEDIAILGGAALYREVVEI
jgi:hypothetical protein